MSVLLEKFFQGAPKFLRTFVNKKMKFFVKNLHRRYDAKT